LNVTDDEEPTPAEAALTAAYGFAAGLADTCGRLREFDTAAGRDPAGFLMNYLMTELWDHGFSQPEIRRAFLEALADMDRYAAGQERR
jgi:hypothetical protein